MAHSCTSGISSSSSARADWPANDERTDVTLTSKPLFIINSEWHKWSPCIGCLNIQISIFVWSLTWRDRSHSHACRRGSLARRDHLSITPKWPQPQTPIDAMALIRCRLSRTSMHSNSRMFDHRRIRICLTIHISYLPGLPKYQPAEVSSTKKRLCWEHDNITGWLLLVWSRVESENHRPA